MPSAPVPTFPLTVYYDAACPLCADEVQALGRHLPAGAVQWVDCSAPQFDDPACRDAGLRPEALRARLHARDAVGQWHSGPVVFEALYRHAGLPRMAGLWSGPVVGRLAAWAYPLIAWARPLLRRIGARWLLHRLMAWAERGKVPAACDAGRCASDAERGAPERQAEGR
ncbi:MAG: DUF393 domain-containing protein [Betaproteobacteria bacterium]|nr:DUF393 domain-containing protein [Betaproteobacteria bacterium]